MEPLPFALPLRPPPDHAGQCPRDGAPLNLVRLHLPGWRIAVEGDCQTCGHRYVQDVGSGHGAMYPTTLDLDTGETIDPGNATWFSSSLRKAWERPDLGPVAFEAHRGERGGVAVLLDCLDPVYGHALLKLLNAPRVADGAGAARSIVLVPRALAHLVPGAIDEQWIVDEPFPRLAGWLDHLDERLHSELERFDRVDLVAAPVQPHPSTFDLDRLVGEVDPERPGAPTIALSLREDRRWGRDAADQAQRVSELTDRLTDAFPDAALVAIGPGTPRGLPPGVVDLRVPRPASTDEERWLAVLLGADLSIGVHGSNMLLASGLARATVELVPLGRYGNVLQASLVREGDPLVALYRHRFLYGEEDLADVAASRVAAVAISVLEGIDRFIAHSTGPAAGVGGDRSPPLPTAPTRPKADEQRPALRKRVQKRIAGAAASLLDRGASRVRLDARLAEALETAAGRPPEQLDIRDATSLTQPARSGAVILTGLQDGFDGRALRLLLKRLAELGLRAHVVEGDQFVAARPLSTPSDGSPIVALSAAVRERLQEAGLVS